VPLDPTKVAVAMASGLSVVCATCKRYWDARDRGVPGNSCASTSKCGSPLSGDDFHEYDGPMKGSLHLWCFVCGEKSRFGIRVKGKLNVIGACEKHITYVKELEAVGGTKNVQSEIKGSNGKLPGSIQRPKSDLATAIREAEAHHARKR
jgi:hypothetical protein